MFNVSSRKDKLVIKRRLTLKKDGILPAGSLACEATLGLGAALDGAEAKAIVSKFTSLFNEKLVPKAKKQDERIDKARKQLQKWVHMGESDIKIRSYADTRQEDIIRDWNRFMRVDIKRAATEALKDALKKYPLQFDTLKLTFSSVDVQDSKMEFLTGVLDIPGRGGQGRVAKAGMATLVTGLQNLAKPFATILSGWERNGKLLRHGAEEANAVHKNIAAMRKATAAIGARLARMNKVSVSSNKVSAQSAKGVEALLAALGKYQKTAKLNDEDKIVTIMSKALSGLKGARKGGTATLMQADTTRLAALLNEVSKLLAEAEQIAKASTAAYLQAEKACKAASVDVKTSETAVAFALQELKLKAKVQT